ncbi:hypothetical protein EXS65_00825 [Candidatus Peribacteria bacterium]|nr:hypothetical protein [Candidatus Peribacteria bacterium]
MASFDRSESAAVLERNESKDGTQSRETVRQITSQVRRHTRITFDEIGAASREENAELLRGIRELESNPDKIDQWEGFIEWSEKAIESAKKVFATLKEQISKAADNEWISKGSQDAWIERFKDPSTGYKQKEYWVMHQMPHYIESWHKVADKRKKILSSEGYRELVSYDASFAVIGNKEEFLKLHFEKRKDLIASAEAALLAGSKMQLDLYDQAKTKLGQAASLGILSSTKVGQWLEHIFKSKAEAKKVSAFIHGTASNSLGSLMKNWENVKRRYDSVAKKFHSQGSEQLPRGIHLVSESQFLAMHYSSRLHYVEEMEKRLLHGSDLSKEPASFIKIRHAIDTKDWVEAAMLIEKTKKESLQQSDRLRLDSMHRYVKQFTKRSEESSSGLEQAVQAKNKIDELIHQVPSSMQPVVLRLLKSPNGNRSINQFRWIVYNNKWCREHGYLNDEVARRGANKNNEELTKYRAEKGMDLGRHDVLGYETADKQYFQKEEYSKHKATYIHANVKSGGVQQALGQWLEREQDPKTLYWTTLSCHEDGDPKGEIWHSDLFHVLTEMRSATRTIQTAGLMYHSPNENLLAA